MKIIYKKKEYLKVVELQMPGKQIEYSPEVGIIVL